MLNCRDFTQSSRWTAGYQSEHDESSMAFEKDLFAILAIQERSVNPSKSQFGQDQRAEAWCPPNSLCSIQAEVRHWTSRVTCHPQSHQSCPFRAQEVQHWTFESRLLRAGQSESPTSVHVCPAKKVQHSSFDNWFLAIGEIWVAELWRPNSSIVLSKSVFATHHEHRVLFSVLRLFPVLLRLRYFRGAHVHHQTNHPSTIFT